MGGAQSYNAVDEFIDGNVEKGFGDKSAFIDEQQSLTYQDLQTASNRMANVLKELKIKRQSRIAMVMLDDVNFPIVYWGALRAGVVPVCLNTLLTSDQYVYLLVDSGVEALFVSNELLEMVEPLFEQLFEQLDCLCHIVVAGQGQHDYRVLGDLLDQADDEFKTVRTSGDDIAFWLYSSGSTGDPKGVLHKHSSLAYVAEHFGKGVLGVCHEDVCFSAAKLFFAYAQGGAMAIPMSVGATTVLLAERPTPDSILAILKRFQPSVFFGVPTLYASMLAEPSCQRVNASDKLRLCISAGEALPGDVGKNWKKRMGVDIVDGVGSTEMLNSFLSNRPGEVRYGTSGREFAGYKLRLIDESGADAGFDQLGELLVSGGSAAVSYWNKPDKTRQTFVDGWVHTGDKYYCDRDGFYHFCGRTNDMFKVSGRWVSPFEVEQALVSHPLVLEAAVVAKKDDEGLTKPKAFVVLNNCSEAGDLFPVLKEHVKTSIGPWKYPRWIEFVGELPKTATGKILRYKLREGL